MSRYCLDTSAYSHFRRGDAEVVGLIDGAEWLGLPAIVLGELRLGFQLGGRANANETELQEFLSSPVVDVLRVDSDVSRHYAAILVDLRRAGTPIPTNDVWIAATAANAGATLLTYDEHFARIARVGTLLLGKV